MDFTIEETCHNIELYKEQVYKSRRDRDSNKIVENYLQKLTNIKARHRIILVAWLFDVNNTFKEDDKVNIDLFFLCVRLIDTCLSNSEHVDLSQLQLLGVVCYSIAQKLEAIYPYAIEKLLYICDTASYTKSIFINTERLVLQALDYDCWIPTVKHFVDYYMTDHKEIKQKHQVVACYIACLTTLSYSLQTQYTQRDIAAACIFVVEILFKLNKIVTDTHNGCNIAVINHIKHSKFQSELNNEFIKTFVGPGIRVYILEIIRLIKSFSRFTSFCINNV